MLSGRSNRAAMFNATTNAAPKMRSKPEYHSVSRKRTVCVNGGTRALEDVPFAPDGLNKLFIEPFVQFTAEVVHVNLYRLRERVRVLVPDVFEQLLLGHRAPFVARQVIDQGKLFRRQVDIPPVAPCAVRVRVEFQSPGRDHGLSEAA